LGAKYPHVADSI